MSTHTTSRTTDKALDDTTAIKADIAAARSDLGGTVEALAGKAEVPTRTKQAVMEAKDRTVHVARQAMDTARRRPVPVVSGAVGVLAAVTGAVALLVVRRRRPARARLIDRWRPGRR